MRYLLLLVSLMSVVAWGTPAHAAEPLPAPKGPVILTLSGRIEQTNAPGKALFDRDMLEALGQASIVTASEVVLTPQLFEGVPLRAVLERVGARGKVLKASALNDYEVDIPWEDLKFDLLLATRVEGRQLKLRDKGPLWIIYPRDEHKTLQAHMYDSRWVWQLKQLHIE